MPVKSGDMPSLIVENSKFINNLAFCGAAIYAGAGKTDFSINNCTFIGNTADGVASTGSTSAGGAISLNRDATGTITNSKFIDNVAIVGGAVDVSATRNSVDVSIDECYFENNVATGSSDGEGLGGAIRVSSKSVSSDKLVVKVENSNFTNNVADSGSAIYNDGTLDLSGNIILSDDVGIVNNKGTIASTINVVVLDGTTYTASGNIKLNMTMVT